MSIPHEPFELSEEGARIWERALDPNTTFGKPIHFRGSRVIDGDAVRAKAARRLAKSIEQPAALIELPDIRQLDHYSCGAAAAMAVGQYFGVGPATLEEWKDSLGTNLAQSTKPSAIVEYLAKLGLAVESREKMAIDDLREATARGCPVITPIQEYGDEQGTYDYGHYVTVIGVALGYVFVQDSSADNALEADPSTPGIPLGGSDMGPGRRDDPPGHVGERLARRGPRPQAL